VAKKRKFRGVPLYRERGRRYAPIFPIIELLQRHRKIFVTSADTPLIGGYQLGRLLRSNRVAKGNPLIGVYLRRRDLGKLRRRARGDLRLQQVAPTLPIPENLLLNINYPSDLKLLPPHLLPLLRG
jgi:molybdopterin-guanine dinucleotide biosynthesis protein A